MGQVQLNKSPSLLLTLYSTGKIVSQSSQAIQFLCNVMENTMAGKKMQQQRLKNCLQEAEAGARQIPDLYFYIYFECI